MTAAGPGPAAIAARWSANADRYHRWGDLAHGHPDYRSAWAGALGRLAGHPRLDGSAPRRVVDVGTGTGEVALVLAGLGHRVQGFDLSPGMLAYARSKTVPPGDTVAFGPGDAYRLPLPDACADVVVNRMVFWTLHDPERALLEWRRVLAPGGRIVVVDGLHFTPAGGTPQRAAALRSRLFWAAEARLAALRGHRAESSGDYHADDVQPPGLRWRSAEDARAHFTAAGLTGTTLTWLDAVDEAQRRTAPPRWRLAGLLPRFFALTWEAP